MVNPIAFYQGTLRCEIMNAWQAFTQCKREMVRAKRMEDIDRIQFRMIYWDTIIHVVRDEIWRVSQRF